MNAITGAVVCKMHGGSAPQVRRAALARLAALVDPAISRLTTLIASEHEPTSLGAVKDVLDRTGFKPTDKLEQTTVVYDGTKLSILSDDELEFFNRITAKLAIAGSDPGGDSAESANEDQPILP